MPTLKLNLGEGMGIDQDNKVGVRYTGNYIHTVTDAQTGSLGLYVDPLVAANGSITDDWTTKPGAGKRLSQSVTPAQIDNFIDINRDVTNLIFTYGVYHITGRSNVAITYDTNQVKTLEELKNEMNYPMQQNASLGPFFRPRKGELIQLVTNPCTDTITSSSSVATATECGTRTNNVNQELKVMFLINEILYQSDEEPTGNPNWISKMKLTCIYSSVASYVVSETPYSVGYNT